MSEMIRDQDSRNQVKSHFLIGRDDLPLYCPLPKESSWSSHPRVFLEIEKRGEVKCPYCGAEYQFIDSAPQFK